MVLPRVITALVAAPLFLWALYLGSLPFMIFVVFLVGLSLWEFCQMAEAGGYATQSWWGILLGLVLMASMAVPGLNTTWPFHNQAPAFALMIIILGVILREIVRRDKSLSVLRMASSFTGFLIVVWPLGHLVLLRNLRGMDDPHLYHIGRDAAFLLVLIVWLQDIGAWAIGRVLGRRRLASQISPKKTWEGSAAGLAVALLGAFLFREIFLKATFSRGEILLLALLLGVLAQLSDLAESLFKRGFGVKDSSNLLPGHGGVLDRFDSFILSTPVFYLYLLVTGRGF